MGPKIPVGQPTTPAQDGFSSHTDAMYLSVAWWTDISASLTRASTAIAEGVGHKWDFGLLSNAAQIGNFHDAFVARLAAACSTGAKVADQLGTDLAATAKAYDEADQRAAATVKGTGG